MIDVEKEYRFTPGKTLGEIFYNGLWWHLVEWDDGVIWFIRPVEETP